MILKTLTVCGIIPFPGPVTLDIDALPEGVVAICGDNGEGKSSLLEVGIPGALYRELPTRESLVAIGVKRDAYTELTFALADGDWTVRQGFDFQSRAGNTMLRGPNGQAPLAQGTVTEYDRWALANLPDREIALSSWFIAQRERGFLDMSQTDRKGLILRVLRLDNLERLAQAARDEAAKAHAVVERLTGTINARSAALTPSVVARAVLDAAVAAERAAREATDERRRALASAGERAQQMDAAYRDAAAARAKRQPILDRLNRQRAAERGIARQIAEAEALLADAQVVQDARADLPGRQAVKQAALQAYDDATALETVARLALADARSVDLIAAEAHVREQNRLSDLRRRATAAIEGARGIEDAERVAHTIPGLVHAWKTAVARLERAEAEVAVALDAGLDVGAKRIWGLRRCLVTMRDEAWQSVAELQGGARGAIDADDAFAAGAAEAPQRISLARGAAKAAKLAVDDAHAAKVNAERAEARLEGMRRAAQEVATIDGQVTECASAVVAALAERVRCKDAFAACDIKHADAIAATRSARSALTTATTRESELTCILTREPEIAAAGATLAGLLDQRGTCAGLIAEIESELLLAPEPPANAPAPPDLSAEEAAFGRAADAERAASEYVVRKRVALESSIEEEASIARQIAERDEVLVDEADWCLLRDALGRKGIQALEIDCAGPELSALANSFLHECYGSRWTVKLVTTEMKDDGTEREIFDLRVIDSRPDRDREDSAKWKSGGESVIIGEAIALALSTYQWSRSGMPAGATWVRDESGSALSGPKALAYMQMIRQAAKLGGAKRVLLVTHSQDMQAHADARVHVAAGALTID